MKRMRHISVTRLRGASHPSSITILRTPGCSSFTLSVAVAYYPSLKSYSGNEYIIYYV
ncbi:MAG: hypothetical protein QXK52_00285 [Candidatus Bathyarchaeia archaeon]